MLCIAVVLPNNDASMNVVSDHHSNEIGNFASQSSVLKSSYKQRIMSWRQELAVYRTMNSH
jgi:hypothetical protein